MMVVISRRAARKSSSRLWGRGSSLQAVCRVPKTIAAKIAIQLTVL